MAHPNQLLAKHRKENKTCITRVCNKADERAPVARYRVAEWARSARSSWSARKRRPPRALWAWACRAARASARRRCGPLSSRASRRSGARVAPSGLRASTAPVSPFRPLRSSSRVQSASQAPPLHKHMYLFRFIMVNVYTKWSKQYVL